MLLKCFTISKCRQDETDQREQSLDTGAHPLFLGWVVLKVTLNIGPFHMRCTWAMSNSHDPCSHIVLILCKQRVNNTDHTLGCKGQNITVKKLDFLWAILNDLILQQPPREADRWSVCINMKMRLNKQHVFVGCFATFPSVRCPCTCIWIYTNWVCLDQGLFMSLRRIMFVYVCECVCVCMCVQSVTQVFVYWSGGCLWTDFANKVFIQYIMYFRLRVDLFYTVIHISHIHMNSFWAFILFSLGLHFLISQVCFFIMVFVPLSSIL